MKHYLCYGMSIVCLFLLLNSTAISQQYFGQHNHTCADIGCENGLQALDEDKFTFIPPPRDFVQGAPREATISVTYVGFTPAAQAAFQYAVDIWASVLTSPRIIKINANFAALSGGTLGFASADGFFVNFGGAPLANTYYPQAIANSVSTNAVSTDEDVNCTFNSNFNWYYGTDGNTPGGQYDFVSVVLHELGHGLGFLGTASTNGSTGTYGFGSLPAIYDTFTEDVGGTNLNSLASGTAAVDNLITGNDLYWDGPFGMDGAGGIRPRLYAPTNWSGGSSYSHLNESTYPSGTTNSLMTPFLGSAEAIHDPGPIVLGMFEDMSWTIDNGCFITDVTLGPQSPCNEDFQSFNQEITVTYEGAPLTGILEINGNNYLITGSPQTVTLSNLPANGLPVDVDIIFQQNTDCFASFPALFTAPDPCPPCDITSISLGAQGACEPLSDLYTQEVIITYEFAPTSGDLIVNEQSFPVTSSPQTVMLTGLISDASNVDVMVSFSEEGTCETLFPAAFAAPPSCLIECDADLNGDNKIDVSDLLVFLTDFGLPCTCLSDLNGNGLVEVADLVVLLNQYGNDCNP